VQGLIENGFAYPAAGDVYFSVLKKSDYGKLSGRDVDSMIAGARVEPGEHKKHPADFTLWKGAKPGEPSWDSPWGPGRPGWHIECSAMALRYLGETLDIHGGGQDLIFPHHENEIAQSEAFTGVKPFTRFWAHNGWLFLDEEKMSKSLGNIITIREGLDRYGADGLRVFILTSHYRAPLTYSDDGLESGKRAAERLRLAAGLPGGESDPPVDPEPFAQRFTECMDDDLNTAGALASLFDLSREINRGRDAGHRTQDAQDSLCRLAQILGLTLRERQAPLDVGPFIDILVKLREDLRGRKLYDLADNIRVLLAEEGVTLEDLPEGTRWRLKT
jgi:cysteinyl-tRNA synthetase